MSWACSTDNMGLKEYRIYRSTNSYDMAAPGDTSFVGSVSSQVLTYNDDTAKEVKLTQYYSIVAVDEAGNKSISSGIAEVVYPDVCAPRTEIAISSGPVYMTEVSTYVTSHTSFTLRVEDDLLTAGDGLGFGIERVEMRIGESSEWQTYTGTFTLGNVVQSLSDNSVYYWRVRTKDNAGNDYRVIADKIFLN